MTKTEAIEYLIKVRDNCDLDRCPEFNSLMDAKTCANCTEAFDMAIKALVKEWKKGYDRSKSTWENIKEGNGISKEIPKESSEELMSRQEAIEILTASDYFWLRPSENESKALNMAIDALTKEPSDDCVSREWVMDLYEEWKPMLATNAAGFGYALKHAPSVVPKREIPPNMEQVLIPKHCIVTPNDAVPSTGSKRGKWIQSKDVEIEYAVCTKCKQHGEFYMRYCPNCGADMRGDAE